jgi:hypothetical protein
LKLRLNRAANAFLMLMFGIKLNDTTNAVKAYRASVIRGCFPLLSPHFNLTVELPFENHSAWQQLDGHSDYLEEPARGYLQTFHQGNGQALPIHLPL